MDDDIPTSIELNIVKKGVKRNESAEIRRKVRGKRALSLPSPAVVAKAKAIEKRNRPFLDEFASGIDLLDSEDKKKKKKKTDEPKSKESTAVKKPVDDEFAEIDKEFSELAEKRLPNRRFNNDKSSKPFVKPKPYDFNELDNHHKFQSNDQRPKAHQVVKDGKSFVPSLFSCNPEAPIVKLKRVKPVHETVFSKKKFASLDLHPHLVGCLQTRLGVEEMTRVQQASIPPLIKGEDCLIKSITGSGKTLAYLVPIVQKLQALEPKISRSDGIHCLIIVPTRELVAQCFSTLSALCKAFTWLVPGFLMGGEKKKSEKSRIRKGINILVSTPGRLLDHIESTENLKFDKLIYFVIDEADRLHEQGFEESIGKVIDHLKDSCESRPQCVLLSATLSSSVQDLAGMTLTDPKLIDLCETSETEPEMYALPPQLNLHYMVAPAKLRLIGLCSFIVDQISKRKLKALIFMSTQDSVDFHHGIFTKLFVPLIRDSQLGEVKFFRLHGNMDQHDRMSVFNSFQACPAGILLCTDVAARGLDLPEVDWIVQYSCPSKIPEFVHRVGRTARIGAKGDALLFLLPSETGFLNLLQDALRINFNEISLEDLIKSLLLVRLHGKFLRTGNPREYAAKMQQDFERDLYGDECLLGLAKKAFLAYLRAYASYPRETRSNLPFKELHIGHVATSFLLHDTPTELGAESFTMRQRQLKTERRFNPYNRECRDPKRGLPVEMRTSEFDSGFESSKRRKT